MGMGTRTGVPMSEREREGAAETLTEAGAGELLVARVDVEGFFNGSGILPHAK